MPHRSFGSTALRLTLALALTSAASVATAQTPPAPNGGAQPAPVTCRDIGQNVLTVQFRPALGISVAPDGHLVAATPASLNAAQRAELAQLQRNAGLQWRAQIEPSVLAALRRSSASAPDPAGARASVEQLGAFVRVTVGTTAQRGAWVRTQTSFDALPVMSPATCATTAALLYDLRRMSIVATAYVAEIPAPPPSTPPAVGL